MTDKQPISERAAQKRINRKLRPEYQRLCKSRRGGELNNLGEWHIVDVNRNMMIAAHVQLAGLARELGCLSPREVVAA